MEAEWRSENFSSIDEMWVHSIRAVQEFGSDVESRNGFSREMLFADCILHFPDRNVLLNGHRKFSLAYAAAETLWYLSGSANVDWLLNFAPSYDKFAENGIAYGAYGARIKSNAAARYNVVSIAKALANGGNAEWSVSDITTAVGSYAQESQLYQATALLSDKPETRQAVISLWESPDLLHAIAGDKKDLPCTLTLQFLVRDGQLHMKTSMRSNDLWLGMPYDVFCFTTIQQLLALELSLDLGTYCHSVGSLHIYDKNFDGVNEASLNPAKDDRCGHCYTLSDDYDAPPVFAEPTGKSEVTKAMSAFFSVRDAGHSVEKAIKRSSVRHPILRDLALMCISKVAEVDPALYESQLLRRFAR